MDESTSWQAEARAEKLAPPAPDGPYDSKEGMMTSIFGPIFWTAIHLVSFNYPPRPTPEQRRAYRTWLLATGDILPCRYCRENFAANLERAGFDEAVFDSRDSFSRFCYRLHGVVNEMLGKETPLTYEDVRDRHEAFRAGCGAAQETAPGVERGCVAPLYERVKGRCVIRILPRSHEGPSLVVDPQCQWSPDLRAQPEGGQRG